MVRMGGAWILSRCVVFDVLGAWWSGSVMRVHALCIASFLQD